MKETKTEYCKKILVRLNPNVESVSVVYGLIEELENGFFKLTTANREYLLNKSQILSIQDTERPFVKKESEWSGELLSPEGKRAYK